MAHRASTAIGGRATDTAALRIAPAAPGDSHEVLRLFNKVFGEGRPDFVPRDLATWRWQFRDCPNGSQIMLGKDAASGRVVAQYAAIPLRFWLDGEETIVTQPVDSMLDPDWRTRHATPNAFLATARQYFATWGNARHCHLSYGFPNQRAELVGRRFLGYVRMFAPISTLYANLFEPGPWCPIPGTVPPDLVVEEVSRFDARVTALWNRVRATHRVAAVRDADHLNWRFASAPVDYRLFVVRERGSVDLRGMFVLRHGWCEASILAVAEFLAATGDREALHACLATAITAAREASHTRVEMWLPRRHPAHRDALELGMGTEPSRMTMVARFYRPGASLRWYLRNWYYTIGDSDVL